MICIAFTLAFPARAQIPWVCDMSLAFQQNDDNAVGGKTPVWTDPSKSSLLFIEKLNVNTDGTKRSYSVDDFWGTDKALNNLCNAMSDNCKGLDDKGKVQRRVLTQKAAAAGWPKNLLAQTRISSSIIAFRDGKPCPAVDGFLVSATSLHLKTVKDNCDIASYVDALAVPAIVIPKKPVVGVSQFAERGARVGDLVVAMLPGSSNPIFAVVGDSGPVNSLGEASLALNGLLLGKKAPPKNYMEVRGKEPFKTKDAWVAPPTAVLIFPGTREIDQPYMSADRIDSAARTLFDKWGGVARLSACIAAMPKLK